MINKRFLYYTNRNNFQQALNNGEIDNNSIVFVSDEDGKFIWTQGEEFADSESFEYYLKLEDYNLNNKQVWNDINGIKDIIGDYFNADNTISTVLQQIQGRVETNENNISSINDSLDEYAKTEDVSNDYATKSDINGRIDAVNEMFQDIDKSEPVVIKETLYQNSYVPGEYIYLQPLNIEQFQQQIDGSGISVIKTRKWYYKDVEQTEIVEEIIEGGGSEQSGYGFIIIKNPAALDENGLIPAVDYYKLVGRSQAGSGLITREEQTLRNYISAAETNETAQIFGDGDGRQWVLQIVQIGEGNKMLNRVLFPIN